MTVRTAGRGGPHTKRGDADRRFTASTFKFGAQKYAATLVMPWTLS